MNSEFMSMEIFLCFLFSLSTYDKAACVYSCHGKLMSYICAERLLIVTENGRGNDCNLEDKTVLEI